jgi:hypothetical protein
MDKIVERIISLIKEVKKKDIDPKLLDWIEKKYGPWDDRDFLSNDLDTYFKTDPNHKSEGGGTSHKIIRLPSFSELIKQLKRSRDAANDLVKGESVRDDEVLRDIYDDQRVTFNKFRTHLRKEYPAFYSQLKGQLTEEEIGEISTSGAAGAFLTPYAFRKPKKKQKPIPEGKSKEERSSIVSKARAKSSLKQIEKGKRDDGMGKFDAKVYAIDKDGKEQELKTLKDLDKYSSGFKYGLKENIDLKSYGYKLVPKNKKGNYVQKGSKLDVVDLFEDVKSFQNERIAAFGLIEQELNDIYKMLSNAKNETSDYYNDNPSTYEVVKPTDLILDYIKDIKDLLKGE